MSGGVPGPPVALLAVPGPPDPAREAAVEAVRADPRAALFDGLAPGGVVPIASFSDYNCPFCRVLTERLAALDAARPRRVRVTWHELPLLGEASKAAARAALAAGRQGAYPAMHARLMRAGLVPTPAYLAEVAEGLGLDPARLLRDMGSAGIDAALRRSAALADVFALPGTPALVVGRTVVLGAVGERTLARLIERERDEAA
jgi:protein-disulfide isomerase